MMILDDRVFKPIPILAALALLAVSAGPMARQPLVMPDRWIVELEEAPTLEYSGGTTMRTQASGTTISRPLAATAPSATGADRFDLAAPAVQAYAKFLDERREILVDQLRGELGRNAEPDAIFRHVMNGFSVKLSDEEAARVAGLPGVRAVHPELIFQPELSNSVALIGARDLAAGLPGLDPAAGEGVVVGIIDSGINWDHVAFSDDIDGFTFTNPYGSGLGTCSNPAVNCNDKLVGVYNFADEGNNGKDEGGHGTHVASTAAGSPWGFGLAGVAPRANIISYKVCYESLPDDPDESGCATTPITQALEQAVADGVDVVNFSIGSSDGPSPWSLGYARQVLNLREAGITFVTSGGNDGPDYETVSYPADAPWVLAVGSSTHGRRVGRRITMSGVGAWFIEYGTGPDLPTMPITGVDLVPGDLAGGSLRGCSAFPANAFAESVALLERGDCYFSDKVNNAASAGAVAVVMINNVAGAPIVMGGLEGTSIPAGMISQVDGAEILQAISDAGGPLPVSLPSTEVTMTDEAYQDQMSSFSSRGPTRHGADLIKPNVLAPGQSIIAAFVPNSSSQATLSGTSMASPHAAGAIAQLRQLNPSWTPNMLQNALETTAEIDPVTTGGRSANIYERGAGRIRVDRAARAALYLPVSNQEFLDADPNQGGTPGSLNLPIMWDKRCVGTCTFQRTIRALRAGTWDVSVAGSISATVTPESFSLSADESRELTIEINTSGLIAGMEVDGAITLTPRDESMAVQHLTAGIRVAALDLPDRLDFEVSGNRGARTIETSGGPMPEPVFRTSALAKPDRESIVLEQDDTRGDPYDSSQGTRLFLREVPQDALMLLAETVSSSAADIDLFVGRDDNEDGAAQEGEERCGSTSPDELEQCLIESPEPGTWWVLVQNWSATVFGGDDIEIDLAVLSAESDPSLVVSGPGRHEGGDIELELSWDQPAMRRGERWLGALSVAASPGAEEDLGVRLMSFTRTQNEVASATALFNGEPMPVVLPGNGEHPKLFIDVPDSAESLSIEVTGDADVSLALQRLDFEAIEGHEPDTPSAPDGSPLASASGSGDGISLVYPAGGGSPAPGRYFLVLENGASGERGVEVTATIEEGGGQPPRFTVWQPAYRVTNQGVDWNAGATGSAIWYTYDEDGLATFYNAVGSVDDSRSTWARDLLRSTSIGAGNNIGTVGRVSLTRLGPDDMIMSWRLNGRHGSERMMPVVDRSCPEIGDVPVSYSGSWAPASAGLGGTTMMVTAGSQAHIRYYFDDLGVGRWVITAGRGDGPLAEELDLLEVRGFCPGCAETEPFWEIVGSYARVFQDESTANEIFEFHSLPPLDESHSASVETFKLTSQLACQ